MVFLKPFFFFFVTTREVSTPACNSGLTELPASYLLGGGRCAVRSGSWRGRQKIATFSSAADVRRCWFMHSFLLLTSADISALILRVCFRGEG